MTRLLHPKARSYFKVKDDSVRAITLPWVEGVRKNLACVIP